MIPRWAERLAILVLLLVAIWLRSADLSRLPLGFSDPELSSITITEEIREGAIQVFFPTRPVGGEQSLYHTLNAGATALVGDGLLGYRILGLFSNLLAMAFLYSAVRGLFGPGIALLTLGIIATSIWSVLLTRTVTPITLAPLFIAATLAALTWTFRLHKPIAPTRPHTSRYTFLGFTIGAAIYTHYTGILLGIIVVIFIIHLWRTGQPVLRQVWGSSLYTLTLILVLALPYIISLIRNPELSGLAYLWRERPSDILTFGESALSTLFSLFIPGQGDSNPAQNTPGVPLLWPVWFLLAIVGIVTTYKRWREPAYGLLFMLLIVGILPDIWLDGDADFAAMLIVQPVIIIFASVGAYYAAQYVQDNRVPGGWRFVAILTLLGVIVTGWQVYQWVLNDWTMREDVRTTYHSEVARLAVHLDASLDDSPALVCVDNLNEAILPDGNVRWSDPQMMAYMLHRDDLSIRFAICRSSFVFIQGGEAMRVLMVNPRSINETPPTIRTWFDRVQPLAVPDVPLGVVSTIESTQALAEIGGQLQASSPLFYPLVESEVDPVTLPVRFGRNVTLLGYQLPTTTAYQPGDVLAVTTYWRVDGELPSRLGIFTRLTDSPQSSPFTETNVLDVLPENLQERDVFIQTNFMTIPENLPQGEYLITLGAFDNDPLNQLPVFDVEATEPRGGYLTVAPRITITVPEE